MSRSVLSGGLGFAGTRGVFAGGGNVNTVRADDADGMTIGSSMVTEGTVPHATVQTRNGPPSPMDLGGPSREHQPDLYPIPIPSALATSAATAS